MRRPPATRFYCWETRHRSSRAGRKHSVRVSVCRDPVTLREKNTLLLHKLNKNPITGYVRCVRLPFPGCFSYGLGTRLQTCACSMMGVPSCTLSLSGGISNGYSSEAHSMTASMRSSSAPAINQQAHSVSPCVNVL